MLRDALNTQDSVVSDAGRSPAMRLDRYRPGRRWGPFGIEWTPEHLPLPQVFMYQRGDEVTLGASIGPLGPDPVFWVEVTIKRPGRRRA
jgi:hypothetical protein